MSIHMITPALQLEKDCRIANAMLSACFVKIRVYLVPDGASPAVFEGLLP
jgi:hypothetical protein